MPWDLPSPDSQADLQAYRQALTRIWAYSEAPRTSAERGLGQARKLDRMRALLHALGTPQASFATILVAGTKGKGSMAAFLTSILHVAGYRVGRYTQPHLYSYRERTWACGAYVSQEELVQELELMEEALAFLRRHSDTLGPLTTFDVGTAQALFHFARAGVDLAVVEVGVGGANDATNVLEPVLALVGTVGLDHEDLLGSTLAGVALHKAGVARRGIDVVLAHQEAEARRAIEAAASARGARLHWLGEEVAWSAENCCTGPFDARGLQGTVAGLTTPLIGHFQRDNAAMAVAAAQLLGKQGWRIPEEAIREGIARVHWPGRFQPVTLQPLTIVDGAHNGTAGRALAAAAAHYLPGRAATVVLGMSDTKDVAATLAELAPIAGRIVATRASHPRACDPARLAQAARRAGLEVLVVPSPRDAVLTAWRHQSPGGATLVTGSLFLVGDVLEWLWLSWERQRRNGQGGGHED